MDFRDSLFDAILDIARSDPHIVVLSNDIGARGFDALCAEFPDRAINLGIAEQNLVSVSSGLALSGMRVFAFAIASHVVCRGPEQIKLDLCVQNANVTLIGFGPGLAYGPDGPTHQAVEDVALLRALPGITIYNPADRPSAAACVRMAYEGSGPAYIRLDRETTPTPPFSTDTQGFRFLRRDGKIAVLATGIIVHRVLDAIEETGVSTRLIDLYRLKPVDEEALSRALAGARAILTVDEHNRTGGLGSLVCEMVARHHLPVAVETLSLPDLYLPGAATRAWAHRTYGLDHDGIVAALRRAVGTSP